MESPEDSIEPLPKRLKTSESCSEKKDDAKSAETELAAPTNGDAEDVVPDVKYYNFHLIYFMIQLAIWEIMN